VASNKSGAMFSSTNIAILFMPKAEELMITARGLRSICVKVLPVLSIRVGRGTLLRPISKCRFPSS